MSTGKIGRPVVGPRVSFNVTHRQETALVRMGADNRSEWIREAIEQRIRREAHPVTLQLSQDRCSRCDVLYIEGGGREDDPDSVAVDLPDGQVRWDAVVEVEPAEEQSPYNEALEAAGWVVVSEDLCGEQWVLRR
ncbi:hypothetical protein F0Q45_10370 [Mycobacterium simiae]|uniref:Uncharacterized protein n=1 Tax=Mycobacterium simiae TaxID=1784 RepID=A0A5B1BSJ2_MYCSI|nr:hypothetical protein [Mycobacterium simiae]KAA1250333.1 hypothetical protein F0Q45_10370 [Mycobacterium simiae]